MLKLFVRSVVVAGLAFLTSCSSTTSASEDDGFSLWLAERVSSLVEDPALPGLAVSVVTPEGSVHIAAGWADEEGGVPLSTRTPVRIASVTKTFVAAAALRLAERGELDLDATLGPLLPPEWRAQLEGDGYATGDITVRQLLTHTAGIFEHVQTATFANRIEALPGHEWTADEQVALAVSGGDPVGAPGERFQYSDTGYVILGRILERTQQKSLAEVVRDELRLRRLGLGNTWWELVEQPPANSLPRAHQFLGARDTFDWHPSLDLFGGGGLLSTSEDLARFFDRLFEDRVFAKHGTLSTMLSPEGLPLDSPYRMGMFADRIGGRIAWQHSGYWGTFVARIPSLRASISFVVTRQGSFREARALVDEIVERLASPPIPDPAELALSLPDA